MISLAVERVHTLAGLWRQPRRSRQHLLDVQRRKLQVLVRHAYRAVPYYRRLFDEAGVTPADIATAADLARLPVTTKRGLRSQPLEAIVARGVDPRTLITRYTAGSTGEPAVIRRTAFEDHLLNAFRIRAFHMLGRRMGDRLAHVHSPGVPTDRLPRRPGWLRGVPILRSEDVDCLRPADDVARHLAALSPDVILGYPNALAEAADVWRRLGRAPGVPRLVFAGGETLTPPLRARLREGFGAPVYGIYGSHEFNLIAWECAETGALHLCDDNVIVEIVKDGRPAVAGESGEVLVTGLHTYASPRIRYQLGDIVTKGADACGCGRPFATITAVQGRIMDYVALPGGRRMHHWELVPMAFWGMPWHRRYQVAQAADGQIALRIVLADGPAPPADVAWLESQIRQTMGGGGAFRIEFVDELALTRAGKHRLCVSDVGR